MPRLLAAVAMLASLCYAQSYDRLTAAAKLWNYVKYFHPRVTSPDVDWDAAFVRAAPKVLAAKTEAEFWRALDEMLAGLKDPATHMGWQAPNSQVSATLQVREGVTVVGFQPGQTGSSAELGRSLRGKGPVVFDMRGSPGATSLIEALPLKSGSIGPSVALRVHSGYASNSGGPFVTGYDGYHSSWELWERPLLPAAAVASNAIVPVFLVNHDTQLPYVALAAQNSGAAAIVTEDTIGLQTVGLIRQVSESPGLRATVRVAQLAYGDGATDVTANLVLHKTGDEALAAAIAIAKAGKWPQPEPRPHLDRPAALFLEKSYADTPYPSAEIRMLAAARVWGVFHYFHPYAYLYGEDWDVVLAETLPKVANASDALAYHLAIAEMLTHTHDSHVSAFSTQLSKFLGTAAPPVEVRFIEGQPVVTRVFDGAPTDSVHLGDVLVKIDGEPYGKRAAELAKHLANSTPQSERGNVMRWLLFGGVGPVHVTLKNAAGEEHEVELARTTANVQKFSPYRTGELYHLLKPKIGYVDLDRLANAQVDAMFAAFKDTDAIIMDMRGYPQGTAWSIAPRLTEKLQPVAAGIRRNVVRAYDPDSDTPLIGTLFLEQRIPAYDGPRYKGKTVMLIDDRAGSQSEHSGLFYKAAGGTVFVGSPTAGVNGDVTYFTAPGGIRISFSGHDIRWPDGTQLQRVGLLPDIEAHPTIAGIRAGRDEILDRALAYIETGK